MSGPGCLGVWLSECLGRGVWVSGSGCLGLSVCGMRSGCLRVSVWVSGSGCLVGLGVWVGVSGCLSLGVWAWVWVSDALGACGMQCGDFTHQPASAGGSPGWEDDGRRDRPTLSRPCCVLSLPSPRSHAAPPLWVTWFGRGSFESGGMELGVRLKPRDPGGGTLRRSRSST